ncbi:esterase [Mycolicibacterium madagascariense]|uniref:Esterase n=1 Tax=Mycolicibacterium madagascariense TaxID=212765 RepID=A0A7I7XCX6_9MYCO|nr:alpha/beta hydrolase [Mycolicibacterium madagascariense]MCV7011383.1 alpha/beta hydrolase [Mycolicibacterium madagascariense]BBZ26763.1 esterase [Mycolicibacterium madagascariense]
MTVNPRNLVLDPAVQSFLETADAHPVVLTRDAQRAALRRLHAEVPAPIDAEKWVTIPAGRWGPLRARIIEPPQHTGPLPVIIYLHGGGWVAGDARTHHRIARELSVRSAAVVVLPEYALAPEARYPAAVEQACATARWVATRGGEHGMDPVRVAIAGDSEGATIAISAVLLSLQRNDFRFQQLVAFTPVTDTDFDTPSYREFAAGYGLRRETMMWFWDQYAPTARQRTDGTVAPLRAHAGDLAAFPPTLVITAEADVVRDEGEAFAARLRSLGVVCAAVRYEGMIHDFAILPALKDCGASRAAVAQAASVLQAAWGDPGAGESPPGIRR